MDYNINFPHLGIYLEHVGKNININGFTIAYYGIIMASAMLIGLLIAEKRAKAAMNNRGCAVGLIVLGILLAAFGLYTLLSTPYYWGW